MSEKNLVTFAREFRGMLEDQGVHALMGRFDWAQRFWDLGFEMDCGRSFEGTVKILAHFPTAP